MYDLPMKSLTKLLMDYRVAVSRLSPFILLLGGLAARAADYPTTILADNPVAYYRLEELAGPTAFDATTNHLDGAYNFNDANSPQLGLPGIDTNSILFTYGPGGPSDFGSVSIPDSALLAPTNSDGITGAPFSAECWVLATTLTTPDYIVPLAMSGPYAASGTYANGSGWNFYQSQTTPQSWQVFMRTEAGVEIVGGTPVTLLEWTHLAVTWDGTNAIFYVNGVGGAPVALGAYLADPNGANGAIGAGPETGHGAFEGGVDEVAFYGYPLTAAQVLNHYTVGTNSISAPLAAPSFVTPPPTAVSAESGTPVTLTALAAGTKPFAYQWYRNTTAISGQTNSSYTFTPVYPTDNNASYYVSVSNTIGSTNSTPTVLTVLTDLFIAGPPYSITRNVGSHAAFRVAARGALPIGYQWSVSTNAGASFSNLAGQTGDTLWLTNVQMAQSGYTYAATVTNPFTSYSNSATLTVQARAVNPLLTGYGALIAADQPVAFFRLDEPTNSMTATDAVGSFDATYNNTLGPIDWALPTGVPNDTDLAAAFYDPQSALIGQGGVLDIPYALELNPWGTWSFEGWFRPDSQDPNNFRTVVSSMVNSNYSAAVYGWVIYQHPASAFTLVLFNGTGGPATFISDFGHIPLDIGSWYHLVLVNNGSTIQLYVNGVAGSASGPSTSAQFQPNGINGDPTLNAQPSVIAQRSDGAFFGFNGGVDEVAFYNYPLSPAQIQTHYLGRPSLSFSQTGQTVTLTYPVGVLLGSPTATGPFTPVSGASSPYMVTIPAGAGPYFYEVQLQ
jgi:hypothetical protein